MVWLLNCIEQTNEHQTNSKQAMRTAEETVRALKIFRDRLQRLFQQFVLIQNLVLVSVKNTGNKEGSYVSFKSE